MKTGIIFVLFNTPEKERRRLALEVMDLGLENYRIYFIDNTKTNKGYAAGINSGIKKALKDNCDLFIAANPDISLKSIKKAEMLAGAKHFDLWGLGFRQQGITYYGGELDRWLLTGGLSVNKPKQRFTAVDWVSGSLMLIKKKVIDTIGYFSEDYFMYYEDLDYCYRAAKAGLKVGLDTSVIYGHLELSSANPEKKRYLANARKLFFNKYANFQQKIYRLARIPKVIFGNLFAGKSFIVSFTSLNLSSLVNKLLNFLLFIFLIRYLKPEEYGIYTLVWAQVSFFSPVVDLGTTSYGIINLPGERDQKIVPLLNLRLMVAIIIFLLTILTGSFIFRGNIRIVVYLILTSIVIFSNLFSGSYLIKNAIEEKLYNSSIVSIFFNLMLIVSLIISLALFRSIAVVFLITFIFYSFYTILNYFLISKNFVRFSFSIDPEKWIKMIKGSYMYVIIGFLAGVYFKLDLFLLQNLKGISEVGIYSAGYKFFEALMFIAASYNISRTPLLAKLIKKSKADFMLTLKKDLFWLSALGVITALFFYFLSPFLLPLILKKEFGSSLAVAKLVMFALPFILISSVFINAIYILKKTGYVILIFLAQVVSNFVLNLIFIPKYSYIASANITVITEIINAAVFFLVFRHLIAGFHNSKDTVKTL